MSAVAGSYSRSVVSPWDEKVRILAFMLGLLRDSRFAIFCGTTVSGVWSFQLIYGTGSSPDIFRKLSGLDPLFPRILSPESHSKFRFQNGQLYRPRTAALLCQALIIVSKNNAIPALACSQPCNCTKNCAQMVTLQNPIPALDWL